jgi:hypothetical protein
MAFDNDLLLGLILAFQVITFLSVAFLLIKVNKIQKWKSSLTLTTDDHRKTQESQVHLTRSNDANV